MKLIVSGWGVFLGVKNGMIIVRNGENEREIYAGDVERVIVTTKGVSISSAFLRLAFQNNIDIVVLNSNGVPAGRFIPFMKKSNVKIRKEQYKAQEDDRGLFLARSFARGKIMNQYYLLKSMAKNRRRRDVLDLCFKIKERAENVDRCDREGIMREEARAAELYWKGLSEFYDFESRKKRYDHPEDHINVMLNYGYSVLMSHVWLAIEMTCLDPYAGFLHVDSPKRPALVVDLMEEFRQPVVDRAVFRVASKDFIRDGRLSYEGRKILISEMERRLNTKVTFENRKLPIEYHITLQARRIERFLLGCGRYTPFILR